MQRMRSFPKLFLASWLLIGGLLLSSCENPTSVSQNPSGQDTELAALAQPTSTLHRVPRRIAVANVGVQLN